MDVICSRLKSERTRLGFNQTDFGAVGGAWKQAQINYEQGEGFPRADYLQAFANIDADVQFVDTRTVGNRAVLKTSLTDVEFKCEEAIRATDELTKFLIKPHSHPRQTPAQATTLRRFRWRTDRQRAGCPTNAHGCSRRADEDVRWEQNGHPKMALSYAAMSCRASAISTESPSWFNESSPDSGTSPEVLCATAIFLAINCRHVICELLA